MRTGTGDAPWKIEGFDERYRTASLTVASSCGMRSAAWRERRLP